MMQVQRLAVCALLSVATSMLPLATAGAQRLELSVGAYAVQSPGIETDRLILALTTGPDLYNFTRTRRDPSMGLSVSASAAVAGILRLEAGVAHHPATRRIESTLPLSTDYTIEASARGSITTGWVGPAVRATNARGTAFTLVAAPMLVRFNGAVFLQSPWNGADPRTTLGGLVALRVAQRVGSRFRAELSVEDAIFRFPIVHVGLDDTYQQNPALPYKKVTPLQHDIRVRLAAVLPIR